MPTEFQHIVVGGGISGLGMAHFSVGAGVDTLVVESGERVGGCINSCRFPSTGSFWVEAGSHSCFNSYGNLLGILDDLGLRDLLLAKRKLRYSLYRNGQKNSVVSALHPLELARSLPKMLFSHKQHKSVSEYYSAVVGRNNYADLFSAAFSSVICQPAGEFPAELLFRKKPRDKTVARSFTFPAGLSQIPDAIAGQSELKVLTGTAAVSVGKSANVFRLRCADQSEFTASRLTLATPPDVAAGLLVGKEFDTLRALLGEIKMAKIGSLSLCAPREVLELEPLAGLIGVDEVFYSMVSRDYLHDDSHRGFTFHFKPESELDREAQRAYCARVLGIDEIEIAGYSYTLNQLPALRVGHHEVVSRIDKALGKSGLALTGNYFYGVSIEDCLVRSREEFNRVFG